MDNEERMQELADDLEEIRAALVEFRKEHETHHRVTMRNPQTGRDEVVWQPNTVYADTAERRERADRRLLDAISAHSSIVYSAIGDYIETLRNPKE